MQFNSRLSRFKQDWAGLNRSHAELSRTMADYYGHTRALNPIGLLTKVQMERVTGIEPAWPAWKAGALPLSYTRAPPRDSDESN